MTDRPEARTAEHHTALASLVTAIRQLRGLTDQIGPFPLPSDADDRAPELVAALCRTLDVPLTFDAPTSGRAKDYAADALATEIRQAQRAPELADLGAEEIARLVADARRIADAQDEGYRRRTVTRPDGTVLTVVETGPLDAPCVVLSPACAMSHWLSRPWLSALGGAYRCVVAETRGTSGPIDDPEAFDARGHDVPTQTGDLTALIETLGTGPVHLMGMCGGAVPALLAARERPDLIGSLSLWHADLELGAEAEKTDHQVNMRAMLDLAGESRQTAAWMRGKLASGPLTGVPAGIGPLVARPYATTELFYRYARLTGATMHWDSRATAAALDSPCLLVTSRDDHIAHPAGSRRLAEILPDARLAVTEHGTHLDAFSATAEQRDALAGFLEECAKTR